MPADLQAAPPRTVDGFLNIIAQPIFGGGLAWAVIESTWPSTREAFERFSVRKVAAYGDVEVARIVATEGVISNPAKIRSVIAVARQLQVITRQHGSVKRWLDAFDDHDARIAGLRSLPHVGAWGAYYVLAKAGYQVPAWPG